MFAPTPSNTPEPHWQASVPLQYESFLSLGEIITNPFNPPGIGQDTGHFGVDFAYYRRGERLTIEGVEIYAVFSGIVNSVLDNQYPYGYTIIIETPLDAAFLGYLNSKPITYQVPTSHPGYRLHCPMDAVTSTGEAGKLSLYTLYAHMHALPIPATGQMVQSGDLLGAVGTSGYSVEPHLHLEMRIGPSSTNFGGMAHYQTNLPPEALAQYCLWRMSGIFMPLDAYDVLLYFEQTNP